MCDQRQASKRPADSKSANDKQRLFPLRIVPNIKGKTKTGAAFKAESEETVEILDKRENCNANMQAHFKQKFKMNPGCGISDLDI